MKTLKKEYQEGKKIYELAGFTVSLHDESFSVWKDDKKIYGYSTLAFLKPETVMMMIKRYEFNRGVKAGKEILANSFKKLLNL